VTNYSNTQVATYLPTYSGNIANVRLGVSGILTFPDGTIQNTAAVGGGASYGNINVAAYITTNGLTNYSNVNVAAYTQTQGYTNYSNVNVAAYLPTYSGNISNVRLGSSGGLTFPDGTVQTTCGINVFDSVSFDGVTTKYTLRVNGVATAVNNAYQLQVSIGGIVVQPARYIFDYVNFTEINQFTRGFILRNDSAANASYGSGNTIVFATAPAAGLQFTAQTTAVAGLPSFSFRQATFSPLNIALGQ
jgi:hypothetical protein